MDTVPKTLQFRAQASALPTTPRGRFGSFLLLGLLILFAAAPAYCNDYYVSPYGSDSSNGSIEHPFKTIERAQLEVWPGDTIFLREGQHDYSSSIWLFTSGTEGNPITLQAYQDEAVILDFNDQPRDDAGRGIVLVGDYWYFKGFTIQNAGDNGINITGSYNIMEQLVTRWNHDSGIQIHGTDFPNGSYNLVINCDSYENYDARGHGEDADGFAAKFGLGLGNKFVGCRAWNNSDDGWDFWWAGQGIRVEDCWAWRNGHNIWDDRLFKGDGNGFKLGHGPGAHVLIRCVAYDQRHHGIDINGNSTGVLVYNCTSVDNYDFDFYFDYSTGSHVLRNNLSYLGWAYIDSGVDDANNSWNSFLVDAADFQSLDPNGIDGPRQPDGGLPILPFLHLAETSQLIDAGIDVGEPFVGDAPDMGAFEYGYVASLIFVDHAAPGANDGSSWQDAYNNLQDGLNAAQYGSQIWVADGIYTPAGPGGDRAATFQLKNGVFIYGGYAGYGAPDPNKRDTKTYETILSGDLNNNDVDVNDPCDLHNEPTRAENCYHVVTGSGTNQTAVLDGFTITAGNANGPFSPDDMGGGMYNRESNPTVTNCTFIANSANWYGGGMVNWSNSSPTITSCTFSGNAVGESGGGIGNHHSSPTVSECNLNWNSAAAGGGMRNYNNSSPKVTNCTFSNNSAKWDGGGMENNYNSSPMLTNCTFTGNYAEDYGGGMHNSGGTPTVTNCAFSGNSADRGGGMYNEYYSNPTLVNCTFSSNSAEDQGGGMRNGPYSNPTLTNCILWGNTAPNGAQIHNDGTSSTTVRHSCIQGYVEPNEPAIPSMIAHWQFDEGSGTTAYDSAGDNDGTVYGATWTTGQIGGALDFDGLNDYVLGSSSPFDFEDTTFTASGWFKTTAAQCGIMISEGCYEGGWSIGGGGGGYDGKIKILLKRAGSTNDAYSAITQQMYNDGEWHHIAAVITTDTSSSSGNNADIYIDGQLVSIIETETYPYGSAADNWMIGAKPIVPRYFIGQIDDVRIYDSALSAEEIEQIYQYASGNIGADPCFVDADSNDYHLKLDSPCIDAGDNAAVPPGVTTDLDGNQRIRGPAVDMGVYESPAVLFVDVNATGANNGSSWEDAYNYLRDALSVPWWVDEIRVAEGVYKPDENTANPNGTGSRYAAFELKNGLAVYGGFPSGGGHWNQRDPNAYETVLSGDLNGNDGPGFANNSENSYHVVTSSETGPTTVLDGFTITAGNANGPEQSNRSMGGGMLNLESSLTLTNCTFSGNSADFFGGGLLNMQSGPTITNCTFTDNLAVEYGGGTFNYYYSNPKFTNCTFTGNSAEYCGGMLNYNYSRPTLTNCTFSSNSADSYGGGMWNVVYSSPTINNCLFNENEAAFAGGGLWNSDWSYPTLNNCTFTSNSAGEYGGGIWNYYSSSPTLTNCILWGNTAPTGPQIYDESDSSTTITYSDVQDGWSGEGNIDTDPCFMDVDSNDFHLSPGSPCINTGDPNYVAGPNETDLDGLPRIVAGRIDMGAYEFQNTQPVAVAGPNQTVYAWINGLADVNLDGSASYDNDGDTLEYYWHWTIDGNDCEANGMNPTICLPVGLHEIELMVHDGIVFSEPNCCFVNVIGPMENYLQIAPRTINRSSRGGIILAMLVMPPGTEPTDIAEESLKLYPGAVAAQRQFIRRNKQNTTIFCMFDKGAVSSKLGTSGTINLVGRFTTGQYFYGTDTVRIVR